MDAHDAYLDARARILGLIDTADLHTPVAATPGWDVGDLLRHVVGVTADVVAGNLDEYAQPQWTEAQVRARAAASIDEVLAEWDGLVAPMTAILEDPVGHDRDPMFARAPVVDVVVHAGDLTRALGRGSDPDIALLAPLLEERLALFDVVRQHVGAPPLELRLDDGSTVTIGDGEPAATVTTDHVALWRSLHGRRTRAQVLAFDWCGDPEPYLEIWLPWIFTFPPTEVEQA